VTDLVTVAVAGYSPVSRYRRIRSFQNPATVLLSRSKDLTPYTVFSRNGVFPEDDAECQFDLLLDVEVPAGDVRVRSVPEVLYQDRGNGLAVPGHVVDFRYRALPRPRGVERTCGTEKPLHGGVGVL
jgi:hypothetical protein